MRSEEWPSSVHRSYHLSLVPTVNRKLRVLTDWTWALFFRRDIVSLGSLENPREVFMRSARPHAPHANRPWQAADDGSHVGYR